MTATRPTAALAEFTQIHVDGSWRAPLDPRGQLDVIDSATEHAFARIALAGPADVDLAVGAARAAGPAWAATSPRDRAALLDAIREGVIARAPELADVLTRETGMTRKLAERLQVGFALLALEGASEITRTYAFDTRTPDGRSSIRREPVGVVGCITPWNFPLSLLVTKVAYALGAGCTVVAKPSEVAPVSALILAEIAERAGLPGGVLNVVTGTGPDVGEAITAHPNVDMVSFTGSVGAGRRVAELAGAGLKRVTLELGGKSPNILLDDLDDDTFARAVKSGVGKAFVNSGQTCGALTRMLVPRKRLAEAEQLATAAADGFVTGDPFEPGVHLGPLATGAQRDRVRGFIERAVADGARVIVGGADAPPTIDVGFFVRPTVVSAEPHMEIAREEVFGPVLTVLAYDDEEDAITIANSVDYGLCAGVWSADPARAERVASRLRAGQVDLNDAPFDPAAPFGGYRGSGLGRENGRFGFEEYLEIKSVQLPRA